MKLLTSFLFMFFICWQANATVRYVNLSATGSNTGANWANASQSLQAMITASAVGDTIYVARGTYTTSGTPITMQSGIVILGGFPATGNPTLANRNWMTHQTILMGSASNSIFTTMSLSESTYIDGVHFAGIATSGVQGGAAYVTGERLYISNSRFYNNQAGAQGGVFYALYATIVIDNCIIEDNEASIQGGFIYSNNSDISITNSIFRANQYSVQGGILYNLMGDLTVANTRFENNDGEMFYLYSGNSSFTKSTFNNNTSTSTIIATVYDGQLDVVNCLITNNESTITQGILFSTSNEAVFNLQNSTVYGNSSTATGSRHLIHTSRTSTNNIVNSIIWGNNVNQVLVVGSNGLQPTFSYSIVQGITDAANHVSDVNPLFVNPASNGFALQASSPAVDAGINSLVPGTLTTDLINNTRIYNGRVDIGAMEYIPELCAATTSSTTLSVCSGSLPYSWNSNSYSAGGSYQVTLTNAAGCDSIATLVLTVIPQANCLGLSVSANPESCTGADGTITATATGGQSPYRYSINGGSSYQTSNSFAGLTAQNYTVILKDANNDSVSVAVRVDADVCLRLSLTSAPAGCNQSNGSVTATASGGSAPYTYSIDGVNFQSTGSFGDLSQGDYEVVLRDATGQSVTVSITVDRDQCLTLQVVPQGTTCGRNDGVITATALHGTTPYQFSIDGLTYQSDGNFTALAAGSYTVRVRDANNLVVQLPITIAASSSGTIYIGRDTTVAMNAIVQLEARDMDNIGYNQFVWTPTTGLTSTNQATTAATITNDIVYRVTATNPDGCEAQASIRISVYKEAEIYVPTAFTPNGDGINDVLKAHPVGIQAFRYFAVFNRWGQRVYYTEDASKGWDGKLHNTQNNETFVWMAEGRAFDGSIIKRKGSVLLIK